MRVPGDDGIGSFPTVNDFAVRVSNTPDRHIEFASSQGRVASFPAWERADRDLRHFTPSDVPIGSMDEPFDDADENWRIVILEHKGFVYVLEADDPVAEDFPRYFRVPRNRYLTAWAALIDFYNPIKPLEDLE
ncbi:MAG TPA: hypothetical protein VF980_01915 [Thermoanaerobaculia bacterium]